MLDHTNFNDPMHTQYYISYSLLYIREYASTPNNIYHTPPPYTSGSKHSLYWIYPLHFLKMADKKTPKTKTNISIKTHIGSFLATLNGGHSQYLL